MTDLCYPFAAIVGQEDLKRCLILCAIDPTIGGVLIRGDKGTAKSTSARGLARLLPPIEVGYNPKSDAYDPYNQAACDNGGDYDEIREMSTPFINLPIGATEDRVLGSLDFSKTIQNGGKRVFSPGLLASANRGILYIDEVNLLPAHLVDIMLDAAAMGVNTIQRDGMSISHPSKFVLVGTMNPEEGDLRPQLLDRFGLMVDVLAPRDAEVRSDVVRQRISFERDPDSFRGKWETTETEMKEKIQAAKDRLKHVTLSDDLILLISVVCTELKVDSLRADITLYKTATALAAWEERTIVNAQDIKQAAEWVLAHRRRQRPFESQQDRQDTNELLDELLNNPPPPPPPDTNQQDHDGSENDNSPTEDTSGTDNNNNNNNNNNSNNNNQQDHDGCENDSSPTEDTSATGNNSNNNHEPSSLTGNNDEDKNMQTFKASKPNQIKKLELGKQQKGVAGTGRRNKITNTPQRGHYVRSVQTDKPVDLSLDATLKAAVVNGLHPESGQPIIYPENWRRKVRNSTTDTIIMFVVDASGSMSARQRMEAVKGAVIALLTDAYQQRDRVGVIAFRGIKAEVLLEPTRSVELAEKQLQRLPTGGRTPLAHALLLTSETIQRLRRHEPEQAMLVIALSDGKANVPLPDSPQGVDAWAQTEQVATQLSALKIPTLFLDTEASLIRVGRGQDLAECLKASYLRLDDMSADGLVHTIRQAVG